MSLYDVLNSVPKHDKVMLCMNNQMVQEIDEITVRWIQHCIAKQEITNDEIFLMCQDGTKVYFRPDGRLSNPCTNNCMSLSDDLAMDLFLIKGNLPTNY